jgi:hypothetical protein
MGSSSTQAGLEVFLQEYTQPGHVAGQPGFTLEAQRLRIETAHSAASVHLVATEYRHTSETTTADFDSALVEGVTQRDNYRFSVWPLTPASAVVVASSETCATLDSSTQSRIERTALVDTRRSPDTATTGDAVEWTACPDGSLTIHGDFLLRLWEWDAELTTSDGQTISLPSGKRNLDGSPPEGALDTSAFVGQATEQFIYARNATLTLPELSGTYRLFVQDAQISAAESIRLSDASGSILDVPVEGRVVVLRGDIVVQVTGAGQAAPLSALVAGDVSRLDVDGRIVSLPQAPAVAFGLPIGAAIAALVLLGLLGRRALVRRALGHGLRGGFQALVAMPPTRQARQLRETAWRHHGARRNRQAVWCLSRAVRLEPDEPEHRALRAACNDALGHRRRALRDYQEAYGRALQDRGAAEVAYRASLLYGERGDARAAAHWLRIALTRDRGLLRRAAAEPAYTRVADDDALRALLGSYWSSCKPDSSRSSSA